MTDPALSVADKMRPLVEGILGSRLPVTIRMWDGSKLGPPESESDATIVVRSPSALRRLVYAPNELGLGRAFVAGEIDLEGDVFAALSVLRRSVTQEDERADIKLGARAWVGAIRAAGELGALAPPLPPPPEEVRLR